MNIYGSVEYDELLTCGECSCENPYEYWSTSWNFNIYNTSDKAVFSSIFHPAEGYIAQDVNATPYRKFKITLNISNTWFNWHEYQAEIGDKLDGIFYDKGLKSFYIISN